MHARGPLHSGPIDRRGIDSATSAVGLRLLVAFPLALLVAGALLVPAPPVSPRGADYVDGQRLR